MAKIERPNISNEDVLKSKALMVRLTRKKLNRNKMDKTISVEVRDSKKVTDDSALRVNKSLFTKKSVEDYMAIYTEASKYFYRVTSPWDDKGWRLLSIDIYEDFVKRFKGFTRDYRDKVITFIETVQAHVEDSRAMLGDAFDPDDYKFISGNGSVDRQVLLDQFALEVDYNTVTNGNDLRVDLTEADRAVIADQINTQNKVKFAKVNESIIENLRDCILSIHDRLCDENNIFRDTLITNLEDLCDLIPKMNIAGDPKINEMAARAKAGLTKWEPALLREVPTLRREVADEAKDILDNMKGML
jgi:hypothetical protein